MPGTCGLCQKQFIEGGFILEVVGPVCEDCILAWAKKNALQQRFAHPSASAPIP